VPVEVVEEIKNHLLLLQGQLQETDPEKMRLLTKENEELKKINLELISKLEDLKVAFQGGEDKQADQEQKHKAEVSELITKV
jgi:hypothetical protein